MTKPVLTALCLAMLAVPALAQRPAPESQRQGKECTGSTKAEPATPPARGQDGTAPGNAGSTGWSGGTGGSYIGTNPQGSSEASRTWQPPTARGLDPFTYRSAASRPC
ncbi:hypothetical protein ACFOD4_21535 [Pseudoroseomonas globiformis]|uniref:Uncharacterized protein n=1 Tax=Teichococcus globiformis TaxID=2307229 RepID=A0ABV7G4P3_9PROT